MTDKFTHPDDAPEGHKWQTRDGHPVRIICSDRLSFFKPIVALLCCDDIEGIILCEADGTHERGQESGNDLIDAPRTHTVWMNVYPNGPLAPHVNRAKADASAAKDRIACIKVTYKDGEGL